MTSTRNIKGPKTKGRSKIVNGSAFLPSVDGRSVWARTMRDTYTFLEHHCGGPDLISETRRMNARRAAFFEAELTYIEDQVAGIRRDGGEPDPALLDLYGRLAGHQRRSCEVLGWDRTSRDVTPSIAEYIANKRAAEPAEAPA